MAVAGIEATEFIISNSPSPESAVDNRLSSVDKYQFEWLQILAALDTNLDELRNLACSGVLKVSRFRSVCWALLLRVLNEDPSTWQQQREQQRTRYEKLKQEFVRNPHEEVALNDDPLSQSKQSVWNQFFGDQELFAVIKQDVVRTFPGVDFFRKPFIQEAMTNILFYYAREHPYMCYRQGMHEILAPILFVMYSDHQSLQHYKEMSAEIDKLLLIVLDPSHLEADSYSIFGRLMSSIESYYRIANMIPGSDGYFPLQTKLSESSDENFETNTEVEVIGQLSFIREKILAKEDLHLHNRLLKLEIPLHIFGIRWLRLLFGREFPLMDLLVLWDAIFADSDRFELPNYIVVAMLIRIREKLLLNDYTTCLTYLMRYPNNVDIGLILRHALHMYMPKKFDRPPDAFTYITTNPAPAPRPPKANPIAQMFQKTEKQPENRLRSTSLGADEIRAMGNKINEIQYRNAEKAARIAQLNGPPQTDRVILDGFSDDSPELLFLELQNAQTIISVAKLKLRQYLTTFRKHMPSQSPDDLTQAVDGIEELCSFLDVKLSVPNVQVSYPVDQALEANETAQNKEKKSTPKKPNRIAELDRRQLVRDDSIVKNDSGDSPGTRYEIPDNGFVWNSSKMLGNRREVELKTFRKEHESDCQSPPSGVPNADPLGLHEN